MRAILTTAEIQTQSTQTMRQSGSFSFAITTSMNRYEKKHGRLGIKSGIG
jgi:hypothetical protein